MSRGLGGWEMGIRERYKLPFMASRWMCRAAHGGGALGCRERSEEGTVLAHQTSLVPVHGENSPVQAPVHGVAVDVQGGPRSVCYRLLNLSPGPHRYITPGPLSFRQL